ncbi:hypothetical protein [Desulfosporosinus sp. SB140]|uniref:hypothetical protein n=1 Tax=Desulfosporosinus paludis TaxID=3115649 RepID=UPI00388EACBF
MKILARETNIINTVDVLIQEINQNVHNDVRALLRDKLPGIIKFAGQWEDQREKSLRGKTSELKRVNHEIADLQKKQDAIIRRIDTLKQTIKDIDDWGQTYQNQSELVLKKLLSLLPYIEKKPIEPGKEIAYLAAFSEGVSDNYLEAFIVKQGG